MQAFRVLRAFGHHDHVLRTVHAILANPSIRHNVATWMHLNPLLEDLVKSGRKDVAEELLTVRVA
ncbi:MAG: hypothetical protein EOO41_01170 [Methanobacteriota archaeon]|nr:MAG: hypothetical protein EOO41_01170 [Euryarchaeota archaeon]